MGSYLKGVLPKSASTRNAARLEIQIIFPKDKNALQGHSYDGPLSLLLQKGIWATRPIDATPTFPFRLDSLTLFSRRSDPVLRPFRRLVAGDSTLRLSWKRKCQNRAAASLAARGNPSLVVFHDSFANRESKPSAVRLAVGKERFEEVRRYIRRNAWAGVFHFDDHITLT
jgi:hypothetical protein